MLDKRSRLDVEREAADGTVMMSKELVEKIDLSAMMTSMNKTVAGVVANVEFDAKPGEGAGSVTGQLVSLCLNPFRLVVAVAARRCAAPDVFTLVASRSAICVKIFDAGVQKSTRDIGVEGMSVNASMRPDESITLTIFDASKWTLGLGSGDDIT